MATGMMVTRFRLTRPAASCLEPSQSSNANKPNNRNAAGTSPT